jgi:MYXO-CTERM domain-containing protein
MACPTGWSCIDFTQVYDSDPLQVWAATDNNFCWPDSLNGVLYREIRTDSSGLGVAGVNGATSKGSDSGRGTTLGVDQPATSVDAGTPAPSEAGPAPGNSKSGCTIGDRNLSVPSTSWALLALGLVGLLGGRRRSRKK